jgi:predicted thioredoxin/glutaredoxin
MIHFEDTLVALRTMMASVWLNKKLDPVLFLEIFSKHARKKNLRQSGQ